MGLGINCPGSTPACGRAREAVGAIECVLKLPCWSTPIAVREVVERGRVRRCPRLEVYRCVSLRIEDPRVLHRGDVVDGPVRVAPVLGRNREAPPELNRWCLRNVEAHENAPTGICSLGSGIARNEDTRTIVNGKPIMGETGSRTTC